MSIQQKVLGNCFNFMHSSHPFVRDLHSVFPQPLFTTEKGKLISAGITSAGGRRSEGEH